MIPPGIDPGTVRLVAQCLNHYATPGPYSSKIQPINIKKLQERESYSEYEEYSHHGKKLRGIFTKLKTNIVVLYMNQMIAFTASYANMERVKDHVYLEKANINSKKE